MISRKHLDARVALPLHGLIEGVLVNQIPGGVGVGVLPSRDLTPLPGVYSAGFRDIFDRMIHPCVVNQFERGRILVEKKFGNDRTQWPSPWQMGWLIRNGLARGGKVHFDLRHARNPSAVRWHELTICAEEQGTPILGNFVNVGDLIVLSIEMEESLAGPLPFCP